MRAWRRAGLLVAWDVHRARLFGRCEAATGIAPVDRLVEQVMASEPYALGFQCRYEQTAVAVAWRFTRADLDRLLDRLVGRTAAEGRLTNPGTPSPEG